MDAQLGRPVVIGPKLTEREHAAVSREQLCTLKSQEVVLGDPLEKTLDIKKVDSQSERSIPRVPSSGGTLGCQPDQAQARPVEDSG